MAPLKELQEQREKHYREITKRLLEDGVSFWWPEFRHLKWRVHKIKRTFCGPGVPESDRVFWVPM